MAHQLRFGTRGKLVVSFVALVALGFASSCSQILGIEDLKPEKAATGGGPDSGTGTGGLGGASNAGGQHGDTGGSGAETGGTGAGGLDVGGSGGTGGATDGGDGGLEPDGGVLDGGAETDAGKSPSTTVTGTLIDYFHHVLPSVPMTVGGKRVTTDAKGAFSVPDVSATYDVSITISVLVQNVPATRAWFFQGLTRRDPTLQVYKGLETQSGTVDVTVNNVDFSAPSQSVRYDFASPDGEFNHDVTSTLTIDVSGRWSGPDTSTGTMHALLWTTDANGLPVGYGAQASHSVTMNAAAPTDVTLDLAKGASITKGTISGSVTPAGGSNRVNEVFVRYADSAVIPVVSDGNATTDFSYVVPKLSAAGITVAAETGYFSLPPYAVAYKDDLIAGQTGLTLDIPKPASLTAPSDGAVGVKTTTPFHWTTSAHVSLVVISDDDNADYVFVVTSNKQTTLPSFPESSYALPGNASCSWYVESHGSPATVDDAAGPTGFLDAFADYGYPVGQRRGASSYTESTSAGFTMAATP